MSEPQPTIPADQVEKVAERVKMTQIAIARHDFEIAAAAAMWISAVFARERATRNQWRELATKAQDWSPNDHVSTADIKDRFVTAAAGIVELFAQAGAVERAWEIVEAATTTTLDGVNPALDRAQIRICIADDNPAGAKMTAGTLLALHGTGMFSGPYQDLLPLAQASSGRLAQASNAPLPAMELPLASEGGESLGPEPNLNSIVTDETNEDDDCRKTVKANIEALRKIPAPRSNDPRARTLYRDIGTAYYRDGELDAAGLALGQALLCPHGIDDPVVALRVGQVLTDFGLEDDAGLNWLLLAYELMGDYEESEALFEGEDPRYRRIIAPHVDWDD